jgi:hypothetical protein
MPIGEQSSDDIARGAAVWVFAIYSANKQICVD